MNVPSFEGFIKLANYDIRVIHLLRSSIENGDEAGIRHCAYSLQQACEKLLKAILLYNNVRPKYTHDLTVLMNLVEESHIADFKVNEKIIATAVTSWESSARYNDEAVIDSDILNEALYLIDALQQILIRTCPDIEINCDTQELIIYDDTVEQLDNEISK